MQSSGLSGFALAFMLTSMGAVTLLTVYCFYRILTTSPARRAGPEEAGPPTTGGPS